MASPLLLLAAVLSLFPSCLRAQDQARPPARRVFQPAGDPSALLTEYSKALMQDEDPNAADRFLDDRQFQAWLRHSDSNRLNVLFHAAMVLKDVRDLLSNYYEEPNGLRQALAVRSGSRLYSQPESLLAWARTFMGDEQAARLREVLWEWDTLPDEKKNWLAAQSLSADQWRAMDFPKRRETLEEWAKEIYSQLMSAVPKSEKELAELRARAEQITGALDSDAGIELAERFFKAEIAVRSLAEARERLSRAQDPRLQGLLQESERDGVSLEDMLSALDRIYDGLELKNGKLKAAAPAASGRSFSNQDRELLADMLREGFLQGLSGTGTEKALREFYKNHPLKFAVRSMPSAIAEFEPVAKEMVFDEEYIMQFLKLHDLAPDYLKTKAVFQQFVYLLLPFFIHESTHYRQSAWREARGLPDMHGQNEEVEAEFAQGLFVLEKSRRDPKYLKFIVENKESQGIVRSAAKTADDLWRDPSALRNAIITGGYSDVHSLSWKSADGVAHSGLIRDVRSELVARRGLSKKDRRAFETDGEETLPEERRIDPEAWRRRLPGVKTSALEKALRSAPAETKDAPRVYREYQKYHEDALREIVRHLEELRAKDAAVFPGERDLVPLSSVSDGKGNPP